ALKFFFSASDSVQRVPGALERSADAQTITAKALQGLAERDQELAREHELVLGHLARNSERTLEELEKIKKRLGWDAGPPGSSEGELKL
ncbi:MAG: hypothetical protein ABSD56_10520, partial [Bryobacteraceae bacterium]